jgi:hypothetical protein
MKTKQLMTAVIIAMVIVSCKSKPGSTPGTESAAPAKGMEEQATEEYSFHKYGIKSGIVTFETDMAGITQKSVLYFDEYGNKEAEEKYAGDNVHSISICDGKKRYELMPATKVAYDGGLCTRGIAYRFAWDEISQEDQNTKAKIQPHMTVVGKDCESFSYDLGTSFTIYAGWQNICLYLKTTTGSMEVVQKAVNIEENVTIPASKFQVPEGYEIKQSGAI